MMMVANENIVRLERSAERISDFPRRAAMSVVYASQRESSGEIEHDGRGLLVAIVLCMACWAALGFFLLT
jgi:hypothetical protein